MKKKKLTGKDIGKFGRDDQRCLKNTDPERYVKEQCSIKKTKERA